MSKFSLINTTSNNAGKVSGYWIQDSTGTLEEAKQKARETEAVNGNKITVTVTNRVNGSVPRYDHLTNLIEATK